jgi:hypothetical protein
MSSTAGKWIIARISILLIPCFLISFGTIKQSENDNREVYQSSCKKDVFPIPVPFPRQNTENYNNKQNGSSGNKPVKQFPCNYIFQLFLRYFVSLI